MEEGAPFHYVLDEPGVRQAVDLASEACQYEETSYDSPDVLFQSERGVVIEGNTPNIFIGAELSSRFKITNYIQSGQFGRGWRAQVINTEVPYPDVFVKTLRSSLDIVSGGIPAHRRMVKKEILVFAENRFARLGGHPNVAITALLYGPVTNVLGVTADMFYFVSPDLCTGGELFEYLCIRERPFARNFTEPQARRLAHMLFSGVEFLHSNGVSHRDLKLENLVLTDAFVLKIMDFGSAKWDDQAIVQHDGEGNEVIVAGTIVGTPVTQPPELRRGRNYNPRAFDIWSCGVITFFLIAMEEMVSAKLNFDLLKNIAKKVKGFGGMLNGATRDENGVAINRGFWTYLGIIEERISPELKDLFNRIFDVRPASRATVETVLAHPWFELEWEPEEEFRQGMEKRPTSATERDRVLAIPPALLEEHGVALPSVLENMIVDACLSMGDMEDEDDRRRQVAENVVYNEDILQFDIGRDPVFFQARLSGDGSSLSCRWLRGNLEQWFTFFFGIQRRLETL